MRTGGRGRIRVPVRCSATSPRASDRCYGGDDGGRTLIAAADLVITDLGDGWSLGGHRRGGSAVRRGRRHHAVRHDRSLRRRAGRRQRVHSAGAVRLDRRAAAGPVRNPCRPAAGIGEWFAGTYAAVVAAASVRAARRSGGGGEMIDLSIFESMVVVMGILGAVSASVLGDDSDAGPAQPRAAVDRADRRRAGRVLHHHRAAVSGLPGADRPPGPPRRRRSGVDARPDPASRRVPRDGPRLGGRQDHRRDRRPGNGFPDPRGAHRAHPQTIMTIDHFVERGVFVESDARSRRAAGALPKRRDADPRAGLAAGAGRRHRTVALAAAATPRRRNTRRPDAACRWPACGSWTSPPSGPDRWRRRCWRPSAPTSSRSKGCAVPTACGSPVAGRPRWDQWWEWGPVFLCSNTNKRGISLELSTPQGRAGSRST